MTFTVDAVTEVAQRLAKGEGRPGAFTPARLFGPDMALAVSAEFVVCTPAGLPPRRASARFFGFG